MSIRTKRVAEEIQKVLSERLIRGLRDPLPGFVTIRDVEVASDFSRAKVFFSVIGSDNDKIEAAKVLEENRGYLRSEVGRKVRLRNTPELHFVRDDSGERAARVHALLKTSDVPPHHGDPHAHDARDGSPDAAESADDEE